MKVFKSFSATQVGNLVAMLSFFAFLFKFNAPEVEIQQLVEATLVIVGIILSWYGRYRMGDLTILGIRK